MHDRQAIKDPWFALASLGVGPFGRLEGGVRGDGNESIEFGVVGLNTAQQLANKLHGGEFAAFQALRELRQAQRMEVFTAHSMTFGTR